MKFLFFLLILVIQVHASVDDFPVRTFGEKLPKKTFDRIIKLFETTLSPLSEATGRKLEIMTDYNENWAQAFARRWETDQIIVYGGIAAIGSEDTFALVLCHESGHLFGGKPFSDDHNRLSLEGQADYWAAGVCFEKVLPELSPRDPSRGALKFCQEDKICARSVDAFLALTAHFADNRSLPHPALTSKDETIVTTMLLTHPSPQCRLDTMVAGLKKLLRPLCWFKSPELL